MFLTRIIYASTVSDGFAPDDIENILTAASSNNLKRDVTGILCFNRKYFLQCLEGARTQVNDVYHAIANDPRHNKLVLLQYEEITMRAFSDWSMAYVPESSLTRPVNIKFTGSSEFDPYKMSGKSASEMLLSLKLTLKNEE